MNYYRIWQILIIAKRQIADFTAKNSKKSKIGGAARKAVKTYVYKIKFKKMSFT